ncbi:MAG: hypothetical protein RIB58_03365 [Phycisphaerales bacterium]
MTIRKTVRTVLLAAALGLTPLSAPVLAQSATTKTYQGRLDVFGQPYSGTADLRFTLWTARSGGEQVSGTSANTLLGTDIVDGLLTAPLDFGSQAFNGQPRFVQVEVRTPAWDGTGVEPAYTTLDPRQAVTAAPHSLSTRGITVDESGRVGVGNDAPQRALQVGRTDVPSSGLIRVAHRTDVLSRAWDFGTGSSSLFGNSNNFGFRDVSGETILTMQSSSMGGNVGIGTAVPLSKLDVRGNVRAKGDEGFTFSFPGDEDSGMYSFRNSEITFRTNGLDRLSVTNQGLRFQDGTTQSTAYAPPLVAFSGVPEFAVPFGGSFSFNTPVAGAQPGMAVTVTPPFDLRGNDSISFAYVRTPGFVRWRIDNNRRFDIGSSQYSAATWRFTLVP